MNFIYGTMVASLLYYKNFCKSLIACGFKLNPYDPCVANRMLNRKQQMVCWHMDGCKMSHVDTKFNDDLIKILKEEYESIFEDGSGKMTVSRGKVHKYLGMTLDYTTKGLCKVTRLDYIEEVIKTFYKMDPKATGTKTSAAPSDIFVVKEDCTKLTKEKSEQFHSVVAKMIFATKRARLNTGTAVSFMTTGVRESDKDYWSKLKHLIKYVRGTK